MGSTFADKSSHSYNLRGTVRKRPAQNCYLQTRLQNGSPNVYPRVYLEKLKLLENADCSCKFLVTKDGKIVTKSTNEYSPVKKFLKILCVILLVIASSIYFRDELQWYLSRNSKFGVLFHYDAEVNQCYKKDFEKSDVIKKEVINEALNFNLSELGMNSDKTNANFVTKQVLMNSNEKVKEASENTENEPESFIKKQCRREEVEVEVNDDLNDIIDELYDPAFFEFVDLTDYALESKGAKIVSTFDTESYGVMAIKFWNYDFGTVKNSFFQNLLSPKGPSSILVPWRNPGDCWAFKGSRGRVQIQLSENIVVTAISVDHIPKELSNENNIKSAPKQFSVIGIEETKDKIPNRIYLGSYEYKITGPPVQKFSIVPEVENVFKAIELIIKSNHGKEYTCVYKVRVHGHK